MFAGFGSAYQPCPTCGASVAAGREQANHVCDPERLLDYQAFQACEELMGEIADWLDTCEARFLAYCARRGDRRHGLCRFSRSAA